MKNSLFLIKEKSFTVQVIRRQWPKARKMLLKHEIYLNTKKGSYILNVTLQ